MSASVRRLGPGDINSMRQLNAMFANAFDEPETYVPAPSDDYFRRVLGREAVIALGAEADGKIVGGLVAYVLDKLEQERREIYIYDLAVDEVHRRRGIATALIYEVQSIASAIGAWVICVQADHGDDPAIALYNRLGAREDVMHFDIAPRATR